MQTLILLQYFAQGGILCTDCFDIVACARVHGVIPRLFLPDFFPPESALLPDRGDSFFFLSADPREPERLADPTVIPPNVGHIYQHSGTLP